LIRAERETAPTGLADCRGGLMRGAGTVGDR
jgi:hypothetical protein